MDEMWESPGWNLKEPGAGKAVSMRNQATQNEEGSWESPEPEESIQFQITDLEVPGARQALDNDYLRRLHTRRFQRWGRKIRHEVSAVGRGRFVMTLPQPAFSGEEDSFFKHCRAEQKLFHSRRISVPLVMSDIRPK